MFFLHVHPIYLNNPPGTRRRYGFDNPHFRFDDRGLMFKEMCIASVHLPRYEIARIRTGQYIAGKGQIWHEEFTFGAGPAPNAKQAARDRLPTEGLVPMSPKSAAP